MQADHQARARLLPQTPRALDGVGQFHGEPVRLGPLQDLLARGVHAARVGDGHQTPGQCPGVGPATAPVGVVQRGVLQEVAQQFTGGQFGRSRQRLAEPLAAGVEFGHGASHVIARQLLPGPHDEEQLRLAHQEKRVGHLVHAQSADVVAGAGPVAQGGEVLQVLDARGRVRSALRP